MGSSHSLLSVDCMRCTTLLSPLRQLGRMKSLSRLFMRLGILVHLQLRSFLWRMLHLLWQQNHGAFFGLRGWYRPHCIFRWLHFYDHHQVGEWVRIERYGTSEFFLGEDTSHQSGKRRDSCLSETIPSDVTWKFKPSKSKASRHFDGSQAAVSGERCLGWLRSTPLSLNGWVAPISNCNPTYISFVVNKMSQFMVKQMRVQQILRYLCSNLASSLWTKKMTSAKLVVFSDADWGEDVQNRRSHGGHFVFWGGNLTSWSSFK